MSRLYGSIDADASKTLATRRAHRSISGHIRGWNSGVEVRAYVERQHKEGCLRNAAGDICPGCGDMTRDVFEVYRTGGSNGASGPRLIARVVGDVTEYRAESAKVGDRIVKYEPEEATA